MTVAKADVVGLGLAVSVGKSVTNSLLLPVAGIYVVFVKLGDALGWRVGGVDVVVESEVGVGIEDGVRVEGCVDGKELGKDDGFWESTAGLGVMEVKAVGAALGGNKGETKGRKLGSEVALPSQDYVFIFDESRSKPKVCSSHILLGQC